MKFRLWLELAWVPWQKTLDVKMSLDATKLIVEELVQAITTESINVLFLWTTVPMLTMTTKTLCQWCPLCQCWPLCQWWPLCQCWPWPPNTVPMMSMTTKTLCQWCSLCQWCPWPPKHCANDDHCVSVDHDNQNTVPMMTIVPMLTRAPYGVINTITCGVIYKWNVWVWLTLWEPDHFKGRLDDRGQLIAPFGMG